MRTAAILPVKRFERAKQRLAAGVPDALRAELARAMAGDVLSALRECRALDLRIVVTGEPAVAAAARYQGAIVVEDSADAGQSAAVALGLGVALAQGATRALCVPGDCPALDPAELQALLEVSSCAPARGVTIVPDRHGTGTNGLLLSPPDAIAPSFGPDSRARHEALAGAAGIACRVQRPPSLLLDIDTGADLRALRERLAGETARAPRTRAVLGLARRTRTAAGAR